MFQLQELDLIKAAVDKLDHWEIVMPSATDDDELQFELTPSVSLYDAKIIVSVTSFNAFAKEVVALADGFDPDYETSLWIGPDGHGANGAPYHRNSRRKPPNSFGWRNAANLSLPIYLVVPDERRVSFHPLC